MAVTKEQDVAEAEVNHLIKMAETVMKEAMEETVVSVAMEEEASKEEEEAAEAEEEVATSNMEVILIKNSNLIESVTTNSFKSSHPHIHLHTLTQKIIYFDYRSKSPDATMLATRIKLNLIIF